VCSGGSPVASRFVAEGFPSTSGRETEGFFCRKISERKHERSLLSLELL
jgi:hypothetical protein